MDSTILDLGAYVVPRITLPGISADLLEHWVGPAAQYGPHGTRMLLRTMSKSHA